MAKTWQNYPCTFNTSNTANTLPDSKYVVTANMMRRAAFVNAGPGRPRDQMVSASPAVCYLDPRSALARAIMAQPHDPQITIMAVVGDAIHVRVNGVPNGSHTIGVCSRTPENGRITFDFTNNNGVLSHIHVGHAVHNLHAGAVAADINEADRDLQIVNTQVNLKAALMDQVRAGH